jgi:hypothetical protein
VGDSESVPAGIEEAATNVVSSLLLERSINTKKPINTLMNGAMKRKSRMRHTRTFIVFEWFKFQYILITLVFIICVNKMNSIMHSLRH